jgi:hypothetical protein
MSTKKKQVAAENEKYGKAAIQWLKKQAMQDARKGRSTQKHWVGDIMAGMFPDKTWKERVAAEPEVDRAIRKAARLGLIVADRSRSPVRYYYDGPEVDAIREAARDEEQKREENVKRLARKLRIKRTRIWCGDIRISFRDFERLAAKAGVK